MKTTEEFIAEVTAKDEQRNHHYNYSKFIYTGCMKKSIIICYKHGEFLMNPNNRLSGQNCPKCGKINNIKPKTIREKEFKEKVPVHINLTKFVYINAQTPGIVVCEKHGEYLIAPKHLVRNHSCPKCGRIKANLTSSRTEKEWLVLFKKKHKNKYTYPKTFRGADTKIPIICKTHGVFLQTPYQHVNHGCRKCSSELSIHRKKIWMEKAKNRFGTFYIIRCYNSEESFYKLGITSYNVKIRYSRSPLLPYEYEIIEEIVSSNLSFIWNLEKKIKRKFINQYNIPKKFFSGSVSECFLDLTPIQKYLKQQSWYEAK